jgi:acetolactate synthase-1/2/3 large subunit
VRYAESFGARGFRVESACQLSSVIAEALDCGTVAVVDCPVDYSENMKLTEKLGGLVCPI